MLEYIQVKLNTPERIPMVDTDLVLSTVEAFEEALLLLGLDLTLNEIKERLLD